MNVFISYICSFSIIKLKLIIVKGVIKYKIYILENLIL